MVTYLKVKYLETLWQLLVRKKYYTDASFRAADRMLRSSYRFKNPYSLAKGKPYGETPLHTYEKIGTALELDRGSLFLELGCGRGRGLFFLAHFFSCRAHGIEWTPYFADAAAHISKVLGLDRVSINFGDYRKKQWPKATHLYLYGTTLSEEQIMAICNKIEQGTKTLSVSFPLGFYDPSFALQKEVQLEFNWGKTIGFLEIKE